MRPTGDRSAAGFSGHVIYDDLMFAAFVSHSGTELGLGRPL